MRRSIPPTGLPDLPECWNLLADPGVCDRGADYFLRGKAKLLPAATGQAQPADVQRFQVQGTQRYDVQIDPSDPLQSSCDCPHAQDVPVCKHMVAAWMTWQAAAAPAHEGAAFAADTASAPISAVRKARAASKPAASGKATAKLQAMQADLDFLQAQSVADLCAWIAGQCDRDPQLALQLGLWRRQHSNQPQTPAQWRSFLTQAMPQKRDLYGRTLQRWADDAMAALQPLEQQLSTQPASIRTACTLALLRLYKLWETADDSHGQLHELYGWLQDLLVRSVHAEAPPASWLKDWLALIKADPVGHSSEAQLLAYAGPALRQAYSQHAIQAWEAWASAHPITAKAPQKPSARYGGFSYDAGDHWEHSYQRSQLRKRYLWAMEQQLDIPGLILLMQQTATTTSEWMETVEFCERRAHPREALSSAQQGLNLDPSHAGLQAALLSCYQRDGWDEEAYALALQRLDWYPSDLQRLDTVLQCAMALGGTREKALEVLLARALASPTRFEDRSQRRLQNLTAPIEWLLHEGLWQRALQLLQRADTFCERKTVRALALKLPASHHPQAVQLLQSLLELHMQDASSPYPSELQLVRQTLARLNAADAAAWIAALRQSYGRKTNFIKGLAALHG